MTNAKREDDDDDMSATFRAMKEHSKQKKRSNLKSSTELLIERGIEFQSCNEGLQLVIRGAVHTWDFWPSTGKFVQRKTLKKGRGVFNLLKQIEAS